MIVRLLWLCVVSLPVLGFGLGVVWRLCFFVAGIVVSCLIVLCTCVY